MNAIPIVTDADKFLVRAMRSRIARLYKTVVRPDEGAVSRLVSRKEEFEDFVRDPRNVAEWMFMTASVLSGESFTTSPLDIVKFRHMSDVVSFVKARMEKDTAALQAEHDENPVLFMRYHADEMLSDDKITDPWDGCSAPVLWFLANATPWGIWSIRTAVADAVAESVAESLEDWAMHGNEGNHDPRKIAQKAFESGVAILGQDIRALLSEAS